MRRAPKKMPLIKPYLPIASNVYSEQVGWKRQDGGITLDQVAWYILISPSASAFIP